MTDSINSTTTSFLGDSPLDSFDNSSSLIMSSNATIPPTSENLDTVDDGQMTVIMWLVFLAFCFSARTRIPAEGGRRGGMIQEQTELAREVIRLSRSSHPGSIDPEQRQRAIETSLITKRVVSFENGGLILGDEEAGESKSRHSLAGGNESSTCVICLESLDLGDHVSWSKRGSGRCLHVFHRDCIVGWLEKHEDCPSCRTTILRTDEETSLEEQQVDSSSLAFVIMNGLVSRARRVSYSLIRQEPEIELQTVSTSSPEA